MFGEKYPRILEWLQNVSCTFLIVIHYQSDAVLLNINFLVRRENIGSCCQHNLSRDFKHLNLVFSIVSKKILSSKVEKNVL